MWIFTKYGFLSAVCARQGNGSHGQPVDQDTMMIRARLSAHLKALQDRFPEHLAETEIQKTTGTDYAFRIFISKSTWVTMLTALAEETDYDNFKAEVHQTQGPAGAAYQQTLKEVWSATYKLQKSEGLPTITNRQIDAILPFLERFEARDFSPGAPGIVDGHAAGDPPVEDASPQVLIRPQALCHLRCLSPVVCELLDIRDHAGDFAVQEFDGGTSNRHRQQGFMYSREGVWAGHRSPFWNADHRAGIEPLGVATISKVSFGEAVQRQLVDGEAAHVCRIGVSGHVPGQVFAGSDHVSGPSYGQMGSDQVAHRRRGRRIVRLSRSAWVLVT